MAELMFTLGQQQYEALLSLARLGAEGSQERLLRLDAFAKSIETSNGVERSGLWVQWQDANTPLPPTARFPDVWPPEQRAYIEFISTPDNPRKVTKSDVEALLDNRARAPVSVLVTPDPAARVGWTSLEEYF